MLENHLSKVANSILNIKNRYIIATYTEYETITMRLLI